MPQFPQWKQQLAAWTDAASVRRAQLSEAVSELTTAPKVTGAIPAGVVEVVGRTRRRIADSGRSPTRSGAA